MPLSGIQARRHKLIASGLLLVALAITWFAYSPGITGGLHFDDPPNLGGLSTIVDQQSAVRFIVSGEAGPLGRPLALATFVPQAHAWPDEPGVFLRTNILIHLFNALLVSWFLYLLGVARGAAPSLAAYSAVGGAAIWMLMPILASSSLFIVQRMTTVSATFVLLGLIGYLCARSFTNHRPTLALVLMSIALCLGAALGMLAKESGALIFLYALALEATLLSRPAGIKAARWRAWFAVALLLPALLLAWYLVSLLPYSDATVLRRGFTGFERLITQAEILWKYLYLAFLPSPAHLGPYHDDYPLLRSFWQPAALLSVIAWASLISIAVALRRRIPLLTFAVTWFLFGHLIESTTVSLELYYEHRNYLPLVGPAYAFVAGTLSVARKWRPKVAAVLAVYTIFLAGILFSVTSLSGNPPLATEMWQIYNPDSLRATQRLARQNENDGDSWTALRVLKSFMERNPRQTNVGVSILQVSCQLDRDANHRKMAEDLAIVLKEAPYSHATFGGIAGLYELVESGRCESLDSTHIKAMAQSLLENPRYNLPIVRHNLHVLMARMGMAEGNLAVTMRHMEKALSLYPDINTLTLTVGILNDAGLPELSIELLQEANAWRPGHPVRSALWDQRVEQLTRISHNLMSTDGQPASS
jgi:uncharacterized protein YneF (UPF0154 family)